MKALILAAGLGTRLAPHSQTLPKALFPVAGIPVLGRMIALLKQAGCHSLAVNTHHLADRIRSYLAENDFGLPVILSHETEILGTGGAIRKLAGFWSDEPFVVVNADIVTDIDLADVYRRHAARPAQVTLVMQDREPFNQVWVDERNQVVGFERFPGSAGHEHHRKLAFTGIHVIDPAVVGRIPDRGFSDIIEIYRRMLADGLSIQAHVVTGHYWQDMGRPDRFRDAVVDIMAPDAFRSAFPGCPAATIERRRLSGDGSDRGWYRLTAGGQRLILADHGITLTLPGSEVNACVRIGTHLHRHGLPVPRIYAHDGFSGLVFMEDLGDCHLQQAALGVNRSAIERLYCTVIDTLFDLTIKGADGFDPTWTCQSQAYDTPLILERECRYFVEAFLNGYLGRTVAYEELAAEFECLAQGAVDHGTRGLIHRDFQSRNIMIRDGRHYLIDFQGARSGPVQYDLAALLIDPYAALVPDLQRRLLAYAAQQAAGRLKCSPHGFVRGFRYCSVTRNLQILGAFGYLSRVKGKSIFQRWIPPAASMLAGHICGIDEDHFPGLLKIAQALASKPPRPFPSADCTPTPERRRK